MSTELIEMLVFLGFVGFATWLDLFVLHKDDHEISIKEAAITSGVWIGIAILVGGYISWAHGSELAMSYFTGYTLEKALSVDNLFVMEMIFTAFGVAGALRHRALAWGIIGAILMRGVLIFAGVGLIEKFHWLLWLFGAFLAFTGIKMAVKKEAEEKIEDNAAYKLAMKALPIHNQFIGHDLISKVNGKTVLTLLGMSVVVIELTDLVFALDSIPAIMGISKDPFIILASNVMAILGLRALYFLLSGIMGMFRFLKPALSGVLIFIGVKMLIENWVHIPIYISLIVVLGTLAAAIVLSLLFPEQKQQELPE